jgi:adenylate kinase family enzyme
MKRDYGPSFRATRGHGSPASDHLMRPGTALLRASAHAPLGGRGCDARPVQRVLVLGRGGSGKSTFALQLSAVSGLPVIELDSQFWQPDLQPLPAEAWSARQQQLVIADAWIMDGDLGPYDVLGPRLRRADTIIVLDFALWRCAWRSFRRGRERADYWKWVLRYRRSYLPLIRAQIERDAPDVELRVMRRPKEATTFLVAQQRRGR